MIWLVPDGGIIHGADGVDVVFPPKNGTFPPRKATSPDMRPGDLVYTGSNDGGWLVYGLCVSYLKERQTYNDFVGWNEAQQRLTDYGGVGYSDYQMIEEVTLSGNDTYRYPDGFPDVCIDVDLSPVLLWSWGITTFIKHRFRYESIYRRIDTGNVIPYVEDRTMPPPDDLASRVSVDRYGTKWYAYSGIKTLEWWEWRVLRVRICGGSFFIPQILVPMMTLMSNGTTFCGMYSMAALMGASGAAAASGGRVLKPSQSEEYFDQYGLL